MSEAIGRPAVTNVSIRFETVDGYDICRVDVQPSGMPVYVTSGRGITDFYVRINNSTRRLNTQEAVEYIRVHWP